jgi:hypothetical protein
MSDYPLAPLAEIVDGPNERKGIGIMVHCPNCGAGGMAWFKNPLDGGAPVHQVQWVRTGDTLETLSLTPSFLMHHHFHSCLRDGKLCVDSPFSCEKR